MKTQLLRKSLPGIFMILLAVLSLLYVSGQAPGEMLQGGSMEADDEEAWTVFVGPGASGGPAVPAGDQIPEYEFGYEGECKNCTEGVLHVYAAGTAYVNIVFSQPVKIKTGVTYKADGALKDLTGLLQNWWAQLKLSIDGDPAVHENDDIKLMGFNTWAGCGQFADTTWAKGACDWNATSDEYPISLSNGIGLKLHDSLGTEIDAYFNIVIGMWTNGPAYPYDVVIDNVSLVDSAAAATALKDYESDNSECLVNYPNPFRQQTTISYIVPVDSDVRLSVYDLTGREITSVFEGRREPGTYKTVFDASALGGNVFICKLQLNNKVITRKMILMK
ncbi:MAG: T9SS type A sorting domain-containing protein [Bacteroidales bacterium]|nr:T9SS type A sorting domain-containing protein [Bacteroidales bacterium]